MELRIEHTKVFTKNLAAFESDKRFIINQGGSSSSKSVSILQLLIWIAMTRRVRISIVRRGFPLLRQSIMDGDWGFFHILKELDIYNKEFHNKSNHIYTFPESGSVVEFMSVDGEQKLKGPRRDILFCNEANDLDEKEFRQLVMRTRSKVFIDFNPPDTDHWLYELINEEKSVLIKSTYKDNDFLNDEQVEYIEKLVNADENFYRIYALGERPVSTSRVYSHFKQYVDTPQCEITSYGLDLGYNDPSVLVEIRQNRDTIWAKEVIYETKMTTNDLINRFKDMNISKTIPIYSDHRPEVIEEIRRSGYNIQSGEKAKKSGIDYIKSKEVFIYHESVNGLKEYKMYSWKTDKRGDLTDEVIDGWDHFLDSMRYGCYSNRDIFSEDVNSYYKIY